MTLYFATSRSQTINSLAYQVQRHSSVQQIGFYASFLFDSLIVKKSQRQDVKRDSSDAISNINISNMAFAMTHRHSIFNLDRRPQLSLLFTLDKAKFRFLNEKRDCGIIS